MFKASWLNEKGISKAYIVLDGFNEAGFEDGRVLFELLKDVIATGRILRLRIVMLSRPKVYNELIDSLGVAVPQIFIDAAKNNHDTAQYIDHGIGSSCRLQGLSLN